MALISGLARSTIYHGLRDIRDKISAPVGRIPLPLMPANLMTLAHFSVLGLGRQPSSTTALPPPRA
jgi:hypothetical protein